MTWEDLKQFGFGVFKMSPDEFWNIGVKEIYDMIIGYSKARNQEIDIQMQQLSWQTSLLMNVSGNLKKKLKPTDLYKSETEEEREAKQKKEVKQPKKYTLEDSQKAKDALLKRLGKA